jgi:hypothetical protein
LDLLLERILTFTIGWLRHTKIYAFDGLMCDRDWRLWGKATCLVEIRLF